MPVFPQRKWLVVALRTGRLANRIVLFANVIAFAEEHGYQVLNPAFQTYAALFVSTRDTLLCPYPPPAPRRPSRGRDAAYGTLRFTRLLYHMAFQLSRPVNRVPGLAPWIRGIESAVGPHGVELTAPPVYKQIRETRIALLRGWEFRGTVGVTRYADRIRAYFTPTTANRAAVAARVADARQGCNLLIGVSPTPRRLRRLYGGALYSIPSIATETLWRHCRRVTAANAWGSWYVPTRPSGSRTSPGCRSHSGAVSRSRISTPWPPATGWWVPQARSLSGHLFTAGPPVLHPRPDGKPRRRGFRRRVAGTRGMRLSEVKRVKHYY
ncbi:MAG: hypothetical protein ACRED0_09975 [Gammaproteobacteria bacterium]